MENESGPTRFEREMGIPTCVHRLKVYLYPEEEPTSRHALYIPLHGNMRPGRPRFSYLIRIQQMLGYEEGMM